MLRNHSGRALKWLCLGLAGLLVYQLSRLAARQDPLKDLRLSTNLLLSASNTVSSPASPPTNGAPAAGAATRGAPSPEAGRAVSTPHSPETNARPASPPGPPPADKGAAARLPGAGVNPTGRVARILPLAPGLPGGLRMPGGARPDLAKPDTNLPPVIQTRVEKITQSEILGPVIRPLPMALLGIAGQDAFVRAANGQTGLLREGEELGGLKLLRLGANRILIEFEQQQKELTIFEGFGSDTLIPKAKETPK